MAYYHLPSSDPQIGSAFSRSAPSMSPVVGSGAIGSPCWIPKLDVSFFFFLAFPYALFPPSPPLSPPIEEGQGFSVVFGGLFFPVGGGEAETHEGVVRSAASRRDGLRDERRPWSNSWWSRLAHYLKLRGFSSSLLGLRPTSTDVAIIFQH